LFPVVSELVELTPPSSPSSPDSEDGSNVIYSKVL